MNTPLFWIGVLAMIGVYHLYQSYRIDRFRQDLFVIRDRLFDFARDGGIGFDHPAYRLVRSTINGYIRFAHRIRLASVIYFSSTYDEDALHRAGLASFSEVYKGACEKLDAKTRAELDATLEAMHRASVEQLVLSSWTLFGLATFCVLIAVVLSGVRLGLGAAWRQAVGRLGPSSPALDFGAMVEGESRAGDPNFA